MKVYMKVLWFTNTSSCYNKNSNWYNGGGWISSLERAISKKNNIELGICFFSDTEGKEIGKDGTTYYPLTRNARTIRYSMGQFTKSIKDASQKQESLLIPKFLKVVEDFKPDLIHVFGSENIYGLLAYHTQIPVILHFQGILTPCLNAYLPPFISWRAYIFQSFNPKHILQKFLEKKIWERNAFTERRLLKGIKHFMGRTQWDYRIMKIMNSSAKYHHCDEILRDIFYVQDKVRKIPDKPIFISTLSSMPYKGYDMILKTAIELKRMIIDFEWRIYGWADTKIA